MSNKYIKLDLEYHDLNDKRGSKYYMAFASAVVINRNNNRNSNISHRFLLDTGAAITILNNKFTALFQDDKPIDEIQVQYGSSKKNLPIYPIRLMIKGYSFDIDAAFDAQLALPSLLGQHNFFNNLKSFSLNFQTKTTTLAL